jgi:uroporphyrinogen III methyltransferase/synthase
VAHRAEFAGRLMAGGLPGDTPVVAVRWGTRPDQRTVRTTLASLGTVELDPPVTIVIGRVAGLDLAWFESRPLFGRKVVVTRARSQASGLVERLRALGAETVEVPTIEFTDPADGGEGLRRAVSRLDSYDWVVFTSANTVERLLAEVPDARRFGPARIAAVGRATAAALGRARLVADLVPDRFVAEGLLEAFPPGPGRVLLPRAADARDVLPDGLAARGYEVDVVDAYRTVVAHPDAATLAAAAGADAITFTSSSTVTNFLAVAGRARVPGVVACIGPITARTAEEAGLHVDLVAEESSVDALADGLARRIGR